MAPYELPERPSDWWGHSRFVSSGLMGSLGEEQRQRNKQGFTEDQQAGLHTRLTQLKSSGKSGLGTGRSAAAGQRFCYSWLCLATCKVELSVVASAGCVHSFRVQAG